MLVSDESVPAKPDTYYIDTSNVLFILSGAFVGLDNVVKQRVATGVCFTFRLFVRFLRNMVNLVCRVMDSR
jgi:ATP-dependent protease Clp ATPase subunit